ncbi:hypothetical protein F0562_020804 [Nyssa sinensis]|uniref:Uncharacterized protein n=1 Tax=Nyssa sinensis TaxID=561372 RepID=A0A5J5BRY5_9ASTE|nr:hypothetical protein F0562_020804 [Nyssa sinensis]
MAISLVEKQLEILNQRLKELQKEISQMERSAEEKQQLILMQFIFVESGGNNRNCCDAFMAEIEAEKAVTEAANKAPSIET